MRIKYNSKNFYSLDMMAEETDNVITVFDTGKQKFLIVYGLHR